MIIRYSNVYEILRLLPEGSELKKSPIYAELGEQYKKDKDSVIGSKGVHQLLQLLSQPDLRKLSPQESSCVNALIDLISGIYWDLFHLSISKKVDDTDLLSVFRKILEYNIGSRDKDSHDELLMRVIADSSDPRAFPDTQFDFIGSYLTSFFPQSKDVFSSLKDYRSLYASCSYMTLRSFHETSDNLKRLLENCMDGSPFDFHICEFTVKVFYYMHTASLKAADPFNIVISARSITSKFLCLSSS
ncbi:MAG: hypothetical protein KDH94_01180, partial [Coxiellaceae bacterium]|nr:hypothetical protein [Coxiellaceae bacterium]